MSLDYTRVTTAAVDALKAKGMKPDEVPFGSTGKGALELIVDEIAKAIINEFKTNAVVSTNVSTTVSVASVSGVTAGAGVSGPGTGTGSGSGTGGIS